MAARRVFFGDCDEATALRAAERLRWQGPRPLAEPAPFARWPAVPLEIILARDDRAVRFEWAAKEAERWLAGRSPRVLHGDHSPFFSRPALLADTLVACLAD